MHGFAVDSAQQKRPGGTLMPRVMASEARFQMQCKCNAPVGDSEVSLLCERDQDGYWWCSVNEQSGVEFARVGGHGDLAVVLDAAMPYANACADLPPAAAPSDGVSRWRI